jgi:hypothetical protein
MTKEELISELNPHLLKMIDIINSVGVPMEGSLFFDDQVLNVNINNISESAYDKALTLYTFSQDKNELLEIGFNSGFSSLVFLLSSNTIKVTSVDICAYPYTQPCYQYLKGVFGDRLQLVKGSSVDVLPTLLEQNTFDGYFIDGGHSDEVTGSDFYNVISHSINSEICADDYNFPTIKNIVQRHILNNEVEVLKETSSTVILKVRK